MMINIEDFGKLELRVGTIVEVHPFPEAISPALKLKLDLGPFGKKWSSAQITELYTEDKLLDRQVVCVVNLAPKKIGPFLSEVLVLGVNDEKGRTVLFDGSILHGGGIPRKGPRCIANFDIYV